MYGDMSDQLDRDQENNALLAGDIRRSIRITVIGVTTFAVMLMIGNHGNLEAGVTLLWVIGVPLLLLSVLAKLVARWCGDATIHDPAGGLLGTSDRAQRGAIVVRGVQHGAAAPPLAPDRVGGEVSVAERGRCRVQHTRRPLEGRRPIGWHQDAPDRDRRAH
jgi:hypothetical protein